MTISCSRQGLVSGGRYVDARIDTSHDYSSEKARRALAIVGDFIDDAIGLYQTMTGETWE